MSEEALLFEAVEPTPAPLVHQGEFEPVTNFSAVLRPWHRQAAAGSIQLETTGVTSHLTQQDLISRTLIYKESIVAKLRTIGCTDLAEPLTNCHTEQSFAQCSDCKRVRTFWNRCENFWCPTCQPVLAHERYQSVEWWTKEISQPKHVILTVRNSATLTFAYVKLFKSWLTKLRRSKLAHNWRGGLWSIEVTNEGKGWHLHAHLLVDVAWIDPSELALKWGKLAGQDYAIVKVKDARNTNYLREVTKYTVKGSQLAAWSPQDIATFVYAFSGQRTFGVFGSLYGKRTQWRAWINSLKTTKGQCECGANHWDIFNAEDWRIHLHRLSVLAGHGPQPPPTLDVRPPQLALFEAPA